MLSPSNSGISIFATMARLCRENNAINLSQGCPDFLPDPILNKLSNKYMNMGYHQYAPMEGITELRKAISSKIKDVYQKECCPDSEITITAGATEGVYSCIHAIIEKGDEVIIFEPAFESYKPVIIMAGGIPVIIKLEYPNFKINWEEVSEKISNKTKAILINSPHNPSGNILTADDLLQLQKIVLEFDLKIISDEVYEHMVFDNRKHNSILSSQVLMSRSFVIFSLGKTFHTTGWRLGYCIAPPELTLKLRKIHQYLTFSAVTPLQYAISEYMENPQHYLSLPVFFQEKRNLLLELMKGSRFTFIPSQGTYFQLMSYEGISNEDDLAFSEKLVKEIKVATIPLSPFYSHSYSGKVIRLCFAKKDETITEAAAKLCRI